MGAKTAVAESDMTVTMTTSHRKKTAMVVGTMKAGMLAELYEVPRRDPRSKTGYQREISQSRVNRLMKDLREGQVDLPTALLLNLRSYKPDVHLVRENGYAHFNPKGTRLHVVDGQHRVEALARLVQMDPEAWSSFEIPFVCMLGADESEEMEQFYIVNSTAKSVRTDLALDLLKQRAESNPAVMSSLIEQGEAWKVTAQTIVEQLAATPVWRNRIRFPRDEKGDTLVSTSGLVSSLKRLLATPYFGNISTENQIKILDAYWKGLRLLLPEAFDDPTSYVLQKTTGVMILHGVLLHVLEYLRSAAKSVIDPTAYADAMRKTLDDLEGDTSTGELARGADFWKAGPEGAAGSFSSNAGQRVLIEKLRSMLPEVEVE